MNTHGLVCDFGRHRGTLYTRLPVAYLRWMVNTRHSRADTAAAELARRGTVTPDLDISGHAVDRASLFGLDIWQATQQDGEGLHAWLCRTAAEALATGAPDSQGRRHHRGLKFVFEQDGVWPVLKTVIRAEEIATGESKAQHATDVAIAQVEEAKNDHWTQPYDGVTHLGALKDERRVTVEDHDDFALLCRYVRGRAFDSRKSTHASVEQAQRAGERWMAELERDDA